MSARKGENDTHQHHHQKAGDLEDRQPPEKRHKSGVDHADRTPVSPCSGRSPKPKPARPPTLSFADELEEGEDGAAFSLAESTKKRFKKERPLELGLSPAVSPPPQSLFQEYAGTVAGNGRTATLGQMSLGASHARGARPYQEDRHTIIANFTLTGAGGLHAADGVLRSFAAVFDGHNGADSAEHAASRLHLHLAAEKDIRGCRGVPASLSAEAEGVTMRKALENSFIQTDDEILERAREEDGRDGACALVVVRIGECLWTAHAGDSRAVLSRDGHAVRLTEDHKPGLDREAERVRALGGRVEFQRCWRIISTARGANTGLAVSRSLGDLEFKEPKMLVERKPDVSVVQLKPEDAFVILASDGLWDVMDDQQAVDVVQAALGKESAHPGAGDAQAKAAATALVSAGLRLRSQDNISVVVGLLHWGH